MARAHTKTIIDAMITALQAISPASSDSFTPSIVQRHDEDRTVEGPGWSLIVRRSGASRVREENTADWPMTVDIEIVCNVLTTSDSDVPSDEAIEEAEEDIFRAVNAMDWETLRAEFTSFSSVTNREEDAEHPFAGFTATVEVQFSVGYTDPSVITNL